MTQPVPPFYAEVDTPALVLDKAKLERNIRRMAEFAAGGPAKLRPHAKTHKCVEIAKLQLEAGAVGITCAKVGEAEALADGGIPDILIANQIIGPLKIARLVELARRCTVTVAVDDAENVRQLSAAAVGGRRHAARLRRGRRRHGALRRGGRRARPGAGPPGRRPRRASSSPACSPTRVTSRTSSPFDEREARTRARTCARRSPPRSTSRPPACAWPAVSGCGTGTHTITGRLPWMTELQCGSYATMDAQYASVGGADYENALTVLVTVISRPRPEMAIIDAGLKAVTPEFGDPTVLVEGATWHDFSEEHGEVALAGAGPGPARRRQDRAHPPARLHDGQPLRQVPRDRGRRAHRHLASRRTRALPVRRTSPAGRRRLS